MNRCASTWVGVCVVGFVVRAATAMIQRKKSAQARKRGSPGASGTEGQSGDMTSLGGGKGLTIGDTPAVGKGKGARKKGGGWQQDNTANPIQALATMFANMAQPSMVQPNSGGNWGGPPQQQWGQQWQAAQAWQPQGAWTGGGGTWGGDGNAWGTGKGKDNGKGTTGSRGNQTAQKGEMTGGGDGKGMGREEQDEWGDEREGYKKWQEMRNREIQAEQAAAAQGTEMRWAAKEQRAGKVRLWLPEEAVRMTRDGPRLKEPIETYGKIIFDWGATLNTPTAAQLAQCTRELHDKEAYRVQAVCLPGPAAQVAEMHETIVALQGSPNQRTVLQRILGGVDFREMRKSEMRSLEDAIQQWTELHGRPMNRKPRAMDEQLRAMQRMLRTMGMTETQIREKMEEHMSQNEAGEDGYDPTQAPEIIVPDEDGEDEDDSMSIAGTDVDHNETGRSRWQTQTMRRTYTDKAYVIGNSQSTGTDTQKVDSYLEGATIGGEPEDVEMGDDDTIRPMTNEELQEAWKGKTTETRASGWKKGLTKAVDKPGDWAAFGTKTGVPSSSSGEGNGGKVHETRSNARRTGEYRYGGGLQKPTSNAETKKEASKHNKTGKAGGPHGKPTPPRGGQKK